MKKPHFHVNDFTAGDSLGYLLRRTHNQMLRRAEQSIHLEDLTFTQWIVLVQMREGMVTTGADICRNLNHDSGATTRLLDQLEARGYIERHRCSQDRRISKLTLTPQGRAMAKALVPRVVDFWNDITDDFSHAEIVGLIDLLKRLLTALEREDAPTQQSAAKGKVI